MVAENTQRYQAASFEEGEYLQIEVAGITTNGAKNPLAAKFIAFMRWATSPPITACSASSWRPRKAWRPKWFPTCSATARPPRRL